MYRNLQAVAANYAAHGVDRFLLARAVETQAALQSCIAAVAAEEVVVCRLRASVETMQQRIGSRELGVCWDKYIERVTILNDALDDARLENFEVTNEGRPLNVVVKEMLERAHWL